MLDVNLPPEPSRRVASSWRYFSNESFSRRYGFSSLTFFLPVNGDPGWHTIVSELAFAINETAASRLRHRVGTPPARKFFMIVLLFLTFLVLLPAAAALLTEHSRLPRTLTKPAFRVGAPVIYRREEVSVRPTVDAHDIRPAERGEYYYYSIIDYLRVTEVLGDGRIIAVARDRQRLCFWPDDSSLRKARLTEQVRYRRRFLRVRS
jgi:hypothetical protein